MLRKKYFPIAAILLACSAANASEIHRVVTGLDANDKSTTVFDSVMTLEIARSGSPGAILWTTDSYPPGFSKEDTGKKPIPIAPPTNGTVIGVVEFLPVDDAAVAKMDPNFLMKVVGDNAPARGVPVTNPLMHRTRTIATPSSCRAKST
jgi:hypothetical protein